MNPKATEAADRLRNQWSGPMSESEAAFLKDVQGFIDFAIRNGLNFAPVAAALVQDFNEVAREGLDLERALSRGFSPKVTGYSRLTGDDFGDSEEAEP